MKKIGIITIHKSEVNYGACLQSFALWKFITDLGNDCEIIDLSRPCHSDYKISRSFGEKCKPWKQKLMAWVKRSISKKNRTNWILERRKKFENFNKQASYSRKFRSVEELYKASLDYDIYITGSDQVWNPKMPFLNEPYFLTFVPPNKKKISYASSFGIDYIPQEYKEKYANWLNKYDYLSTREESGASIVKDLTGKNPEVVLDPVFLLPKVTWEKYTQDISGIAPHSYIFVYMLKYDERTVKHAIALAEKRRKPLYMVLSEEKIVEHPMVKQLVSLSPSEWLWLVANADVFVTSSFHGTALSIIFNTPFVVFLENGVPTNNRILDMLASMGMMENLFDVNTASSEWIHSVRFGTDGFKDYSMKLKESRDYLIKAISND